MKHLMTAVLLCIACLTFAGCFEGSPPSLTLPPGDHPKYKKPNWYREDKPGQIWIHRKNCKVVKNDWKPISDEQAGYWANRQTTEAAKPKSEWNHDEVMRNWDGRRVIVYCPKCP